ncbi:hypothetical protein BDV38DRAFT_237992 [Aspergillus pseudotamarii]|uniref:Uncharacterized protein n=1 Tax=Aspergillus pseudotamarii TaxID=132259 RepID=A0A5N6T573_ASPPS|nr:uncharacterized protein BDV38DRAFT_237992 [Aspergillus pseudotamarii]KAE8141463.1 hypothetical protein BDV38DRAFT_237992 [Aspergillus pseudotamarii]
MTTDPLTIKRLYITPFTAELLPSVLPPSVQPLAREISFHSIPTFPENNYGYVTLPAMEADKIKKKLNGSILKGRKFKVDVARPQKRQRGEGEDEIDKAASNIVLPSGKKSKKRKDVGNVLEGHELQTDRQVKRGWTESTSSLKERRKEEKRNKKKDDRTGKSQAKSKYTEKAECLFRTKIPLNRASSAEVEQDKQSKKKKKKSSQESVVHEFSKTVTHPSFLRTDSDGASPTFTFEEGKGWIDGSGNIKEQASDRIRSDQYTPGKIGGAKEKPKSKSSPKAKASSQSLDDANSAGRDLDLKESDESEDWTSSSGATSSDDSVTDSESEASVASGSSDTSDISSDQDEQGAQSMPQGVEKVSGPEVKVDQGVAQAEKNDEPHPQEVHPLEALFKRSATDTTDVKPDPDASAQFSFFGQGDMESEEESQDVAEPQTPFTKKDLQSRGLRSAAPTPDTALAGRIKKWNTLEQHDSMNVDDEQYTNTPIPKLSSGLKYESEFAKWFWENRGDNNRAWKKRRRDAAKEQRQMENRRTGMKGKS